MAIEVPLNPPAIDGTITVSNCMEDETMDFIRSTGSYTQGLQGPAQRSDEPSSPAGPQDHIELSRDRENLAAKDTAVLEKTIAQLPKVDLHRHLEGAIRPETVWGSCPEIRHRASCQYPGRIETSRLCQ